MKVAGAYRSRKTACRDITKLIKRTPGTTLNIPIDVCEVQVKLRKPIRGVKVWWPVIRMDSWCQYLLRWKPQLLLGGHAVAGNWRGLFREFWSNYKLVCGDHPIFSTNWDLGTCVPYHFHGDEGRGQLKRPYMVVSWQVVISHHGPQVCNESSFLISTFCNILIFVGVGAFQK